MNFHDTFSFWWGIRYNIICHFTSTDCMLSIILSGYTKGQIKPKTHIKNNDNNGRQSIPLTSFLPKSPPGFIVATIRNSSVAFSCSIRSAPECSVSRSVRSGSSTLFSRSRTESSASEISSMSRTPPVRIAVTRGPSTHSNSGADLPAAICNRSLNRWWKLKRYILVESDWKYELINLALEKNESILFQSHAT